MEMSNNNAVDIWRVIVGFIEEEGVWKHQQYPYGEQNKYYLPQHIEAQASARASRIRHIEWKHQYHDKR